MGKNIHRLIVSTLIVFAMSIPAAALNFSDVSPSDYYYDAVCWAVGEGITNGTSDTTFDPDVICNRGQVVTLLWRAKGEPSPSISENPFIDVTQDDWFYTAVLWAVGEGITNGTSDTTFAPYDPCIDAQVITFLHRAMGQPAPTTTSDLAPTTDALSYSATPISWADEMGLLDGLAFSATELSPRSHIVTYLYRDAGSPALPQSDALSYNYPQVAEPSSVGQLSTDYYDQVILYMMANDIIAFTSSYTADDMYEFIDTGIYDIIQQSFSRTRALYGDLGSFYGWMNRSISFDGISAITVTVTLGNQYISDSDLLQSYLHQFIYSAEEIASQLVADGTVDPDGSQYDIALALYRWCAYNLSYDTTALSNTISYTGYGATQYGTAVCQGYVALYNALCNIYGIEIYGISGSAGGDGHIWCYAQLDGSWYYIDPTWGDPLPDRANYCNEAYFALSRSQLETTHTFDPLFDEVAK